MKFMSPSERICVRSGLGPVECLDNAGICLDKTKQGVPFYVRGNLLEGVKDERKGRVFF